MRNKWFIFISVLGGVGLQWSTLPLSSSVLRISVTMRSSVMTVRIMRKKIGSVLIVGSPILIIPRLAPSVRLGAVLSVALHVLRMAVLGWFV